MFDFSATLNLPLIFGAIIAFAIFMYVLLDGFDLGVGILFPFAPSDDCRHKMMNSIAPFWDGNETWLVLGGGGLLAAFPLAYSMILPSFYLPIILMLLGLIFRGVAFEFRFKSHSMFEQRIWDYSFHFGSIAATFFQGIILGSFIQGNINGATWDWLNAFSIMSGVALVAGYALLGATWLIMKTHERTQDWAYHCAFYILFFVAFFILLVSVWTPFLNDEIYLRWFVKPNIYYLALILVMTVLALILLAIGLRRKNEILPFVCAVMIFILAYVGLAITLFPYAVPYKITFATAAAAPESLSLLLIGVLIVLPVILGYTFYSYYVFRGKVKSESLY